MNQFQRIGLVGTLDLPEVKEPQNLSLELEPNLEKGHNPVSPDQIN